MATASNAVRVRPEFFWPSISDWNVLGVVVDQCDRIVFDTGGAEYDDRARSSTR
ncbi:hypothetical protein ACWC5I_26505 [Kitasatospora sp. NPDC001574]